MACQLLRFLDEARKLAPKDSSQGLKLQGVRPSHQTVLGLFRSRVPALLETRA